MFFFALLFIYVALYVILYGVLNVMESVSSPQTRTDFKKGIVAITIGVCLLVACCICLERELWDAQCSPGDFDLMEIVFTNE